VIKLVIIIYGLHPYFSRVQLSGIKSKNVIYLVGVYLMVLGVIPKIGALTTIIPSAVLGGAMVAMFGMVIASGIKMLSRVDLTSQGNLMIIACSVGMGMGVTVVPKMFTHLPENFQILTSNGIVAGSFTAILLNLLFNHSATKQKKSIEIIGQKAS
jgi:xanthine permease